MIFYLIVIPALWIAYSIIEGTREAYLYAYRAADWDPGYSLIKTTKNLHPLFVAQRAIVAGALLMCFTFHWYLIFALAAFALVFPVVHDGVYYLTRHQLDPAVYKLGFLDTSKTSTARFTFGLYTRLYMAIAGCACYGVFAWLQTS